MLDDIYTDKNGVFKNKLGIKDKNELQIAETDFSHIKSLTLKKSSSDLFDLSLLKKIHTHLFIDVYAWAGKIRTVDISKGNDRFGHYGYIEKEANKLFKGLLDEGNLQGLNSKNFSMRAGDYLGEINALHPFREGNGRTQRMFIGLIAESAGYKIDWFKIKKEDMLKGSIESFYGNSDTFSRLIETNLSAITKPEFFETSYKWSQEDRKMILNINNQNPSEIDSKVLGNIISKDHFLKKYSVEAIKNGKLDLSKAEGAQPVPAKFDSNGNIALTQQIVKTLKL